MNVTKEDFVSEAAFEEYERTVDLFWGELVSLNTTIYLLERIVEFPWNLFGELHRMSTFFYTIMISFFTSAVLTITRLTTDNRDGPTMRRFRNKLRNELIKPDSRAALNLDGRLGQLGKLLESIESPLQKAKSVRNQFVAHLGRELLLPAEQQKFERIYLTDLVEIRNALNQAFEILALKDDVEYDMLPLEYSSKVINPAGARNDIEEILDSIAGKSFIWRAPDTPDWEWRRKRYTDEQIAQLNHYREKFGLPPV